MVDLVALDPAVQACGFHRGKGAFFEHGRVHRQDAGECFAGCAEFFGELLGDSYRATEECARFGREGTALEQASAVGDAFEEGILEINEEEAEVLCWIGHIFWKK